MRFVALAVMLLGSTSVFAQTMTVKIVDRHSSETGYSYQVPGRTSSDTTASANCYGSGNYANCNGNSTTNGTYTAPRNVSYSVTGATLALLLPDGRTAVVNCASKSTFEMAAPAFKGHRDCKTPFGSEVEVTFSGKSAKLRWPASIDGKKSESETYAVIGILAKP